MASRFGLEIRAAEARDAEDLATLLALGGGAKGAEGLIARLDKMRSGDGVVLIAAEWGPPSGVIALNWAWTLTADLRVAYITSLVVAPEARRRGIARLLLKAASQSARAAHCGQITILAPADSQPLRDFCVATGFVESADVFTRSLRKGR